MSDDPAAATSPREDAIEVAWRTLEASWEDDAAHRAFVGLCLAQDRLSEAGQRYRQVKETDPARRAEAERRIERLLGLAMQRLEIHRSEPPRRARRVIFLVALALSSGIIGWTLWTWWETR